MKSTTYGITKVATTSGRIDISIFNLFIELSFVLYWQSELIKYRNELIVKVFESIVVQVHLKQSQ